MQLLSFLDQRKDKIQILERSLGFVKIQFQAEDFFNFLGISLDKCDTRQLAKTMDIMHGQSPRMTVFSETPVEKNFKVNQCWSMSSLPRFKKGPLLVKLE